MKYSVYSKKKMSGKVNVSVKPTMLLVSSAESLRDTARDPQIVFISYGNHIIRCPVTVYTCLSVQNQPIQGHVFCTRYQRTFFHMSCNHL